MKRNAMCRFLAGVAAVSGLCAAPMALSKPIGGSDWLWLSTLAIDTGTCTFTIKVDWHGFRAGHTLEVFLTQGYTGAKLVPAYVKVNGQDSTATVTLPSLVPDTQTPPSLYYPWAQLLDNKGAAIPASLDFTGQTLLYCVPPG